MSLSIIHPTQSESEEYVLPVVLRAPTFVAHDFTNGSFDHLEDPRDDFAEMLDSLVPAPEGEVGPFDRTPHHETVDSFYYVGSVLRQRSVTVITNRPRQ